MAGVARTRTITSTHDGGGTYVRPSKTSTNGPITVQTKRCDDIVGDPQGDHTLTITDTKRSFVILNGYDSQLNVQYNNWRSVDFPPIQAYFPSFNVNSLATRVGAGTNPGRPVVNLPVFIWELRELPGLIRLAGQSILGKISSGYLSWNFGWAPLLSDLRKLVTLQDSIDKRLKELQNLKKKGYMRRRLDLEEKSLDATGSHVFESSSTIVTVKRLSQNHRKIWGTVKWRMSSATSIPDSQAEQIALARRSVLGLVPGNITLALWEALPWTWLIDWFADFGAYFKATNNSIAYAVNGSACIMVRTIVQDTVVSTSSSRPAISVDPQMGHLIKKQRFIGTFSPLSMSLPILSNGQLATAAALATQRLDAYAHLRRK